MMLLGAWDEAPPVHARKRRKGEHQVLETVVAQLYSAYRQPVVAKTPGWEPGQALPEHPYGWWREDVGEAPR